jgi:hypothetical protein
MYQSEFFFSFSNIKILEKINKRLAKLFEFTVFFFLIPIPLSKNGKFHQDKKH